MHPFMSAIKEVIANEKKKKTDEESYSFLISFRPHVFTQVKGFVYSSKN